MAYTNALLFCFVFQDNFNVIAFMVWRPGSDAQKAMAPEMRFSTAVLFGGAARLTLYCTQRAKHTTSIFDDVTRKSFLSRTAVETQLNMDAKHGIHHISASTL